MAELLSIASSAISIADDIPDLCIRIFNFGKTVTSSKGDLESIQHELTSLKPILDTLDHLARSIANEASGTLPQPLTRQISHILDGCGHVVKQISHAVLKYNTPNIFNKTQWAVSGKEETSSLRVHLESYKATLNITVEMLSL